MSTPPPETLHFYGRGAAWVEAIKAIGLDPALVPVCGQQGGARATTIEAVTCPVCIEIRPTATGSPEGAEIVAAAIKLVATNPALDLVQTVRMVRSQAPQPGAAPQQPQGSPPSFHGIPPEMVHTTGLAPFVLIDLIVRGVGLAKGQKLVSPPPPTAIRMQVGQQILGLAMAVPGLQALLASPWFAGVMILTGIIGAVEVCEMVSEDGGEDMKRRQITPRQWAEALQR